MSAPTALTQAQFPLSRFVPGAAWNCARYGGLVTSLSNISPDGIVDFAIQPEAIDPLLLPRYRALRCVARAVIAGPENAIVTYSRSARVDVGSHFTVHESAPRLSRLTGSTTLHVEYCFDIDVPSMADGLGGMAITLFWQPTPCPPMLVQGADLEVMAFRTSGPAMQWGS